MTVSVGGAVMSPRRIAHETAPSASCSTWRAMPAEATSMRAPITHATAGSPATAFSWALHGRAIEHSNTAPTLTSFALNLLTSQGPAPDYPGEGCPWLVGSIFLARSA